MNRYLIIGSGLLIAIIQIMHIIILPWNEVNQTWAVFDCFFAIFFIVTGVINRETFYLVASVFFIIFLLISFLPAIRIITTVESTSEISLLIFTRIGLLLLALYGILKKLKGFEIFTTKIHN